ncbi:hypothetical protein RUND412_000726 [Rhizina undulata]
MASKIIVVGATNGCFEEAFTKVSTLHAKNSFSLALITGDLFGEPSSTSPTEEEDIQRLLRGEIQVPLPTYFTLGQYSLPTAVEEKISKTSGEVCDNLFFLGKKSVLTTSDGIRMVALGGRLDANLIGVSKNDSEEADAAPFYSAEDVKALKGANNADLLITYEWPESVDHNSAKELPADERTKGVSVVAELANALRPRYHFAAGGEQFWEREPYRNSIRGKENSKDLRITRFLGVADWGNLKKAKALYAFSINVKETSAIAPARTTPSPYKFEEATGRKRGREATDGSGTFFWGDQSGGGDRGVSKRGRGRGRLGRGREARPAPVGPESCFFCVSNPTIEKHLIVSIGNESYLTTAKGPLTRASSNPKTLPFSSHILIIPLAHSPEISSMEDEASRSATLEEMTNYRLALERMLKTRECGAVTFEISRSTGVHCHWQVIPVPEDKLGEVEKAFQDEAENDKLGAFEQREVEKTEGDYFRIWISGMDCAYVLKLPPMSYFDLQFGRRVLAKLMGLQNVHWKDNPQTHTEEVDDAKAFKAAFRPFDFSL